MHYLFPKKTRSEEGKEMKAKYSEYDDDGKVLKETEVNYRITWGEKKPTIHIELPDKSKTRHVIVDIPLKQFINLHNKQVGSKRITKLRECYDD